MTSRLPRSATETNRSSKPYAEFWSGTGTWLRCHPMFADLLQLELRRTAPGQITGLHQAAAAWLAGHGLPVEAVRHGELSWRGSSRARRVLNHLVWVAIGHLGGR